MEKEFRVEVEIFAKATKNLSNISYLLYKYWILNSGHNSTRTNFQIIELAIILFFPQTARQQRKKENRMESF